MRSNTIWLCASCYSCSVCCPRGVDLTGLMYRLKQMAAARGVVNESVWFYRVFVENLRKRGVIYEPELMLAYARRAGVKALVPHAGMALQMACRRKLAFRPRRLADREGFARVAGEILKKQNGIHG